MLYEVPKTPWKLMIIGNLKLPEDVEDHRRPAMGRPRSSSKPVYDGVHAALLMVPENTARVGFRSQGEIAYQT